MLRERRSRGAEAREHEAAVARYAWDGPQAVRAFVERRVAAGVRDAEQGTVQIVRPAVIRTGERPRVAARRRTQHRPAMHAPVEEDRHAAVLLAHHDDRLRADLAGDEVARARNLAVVTDEHPAAREDPVHLVGEDAWIGVERDVDPVILHERLVVDAERSRDRHVPVL